MGDAKTRLGSLFAANGAQAPQGNDALRYVAPKEPSRGSQSATGAAQPAVQASAPAATNSVVFHTSVSLYQYDSATRGYAQVGGAKAQVGCVLVGAETTYAVLFYDAEKTPLCQVPLKAWNPTVQPRNFLNFYDEKRTNWSMKFATEDALVEFMKQVFLAKIHAEIWSSKRTIDASALWKQDLGASAIKTTTADDASGAPVAAGDRVRVEFKCWRVVGRASSPPNDVVTKYPPFEKTNDGETRKFRIGDGSERIKALDEGVIGMKRGGKRMILAPPGKTNGQDWYIVDVTLVDSRSGGGRRESQKSEEAPAPTPTPAEKTKRKSRSSVRENSLENEGNRGDIVPYQDESSGNASRHEMDMKELKLLQLEKELKMKEQMLAGGVANGGMQGQAQMQVPGFSTSYNGLGVGGAFSPYGSIYSPAQPAQGLMTPSGRPLDGMIMELHAKIDYLIRMAPGSGPGGSTPSFGGPVGATDVQSVLRGVERLAGENERLLLQINSQNQQYASYEKRCEELLKQNQRLQDEKRMADEKYQSMASLQLNYNAEISSLTSARDAAITQVNRIHSDYQQLLTAFYQKQQASTENEEQRNALEFERQSRVRLEKELQKETQTRSLVEQELTLVKKQLDVLMKMKESEVQSHRQEMEHQVQTLKASQQQEIEDRIKRITTEYQQQEKRLQQEWDAQMERQTTQARADLEKVQAQLEALTTEKQHTSLALEASQVRVRELEASLATQAAATIDSVGTVGLDEEEKRIYQEQIELLQQQVKELEAEKYERLQQDMDAGRLSSPSSSPRNRKKLEIVDDDASAKAEELMAAARAKEEAAERTLAMAEEIKREAEAVLRDQQSPSSNQDPSAAREKTVTLFKEAVNEMFFRFQDVFEDESYATASLEGRQVLTVVRKVLKQSTKDVIQRLQEEDEVTASQPAATSAPTPTPAPAPVSVPAASPSSSFSLPTAVAVGAATGLAAAAVVAAATDDNDDDDGRASNASSEGPPPPPELDETEPLASALEASEKPDEQHKREEEPEPKEEDDEAEDTADDGADDLLFGAASVSVPSAVTYPIVRRAADVSDDSDDDFDD